MTIKKKTSQLGINSTGVVISQETPPPRFRDLPCPDVRANHESARTPKMAVVRAHVCVLRARSLIFSRGAINRIFFGIGDTILHSHSKKSIAKPCQDAQKPHARRGMQLIRPIEMKKAASAWCRTLVDGLHG